MAALVELSDVHAAKARISDYVRRTPLVPAQPVKQPASASKNIVLKLECMQITGSFKPRGAVNKLLSLPPEQIQRGVITASGGNHGLGVAYAGWLAKSPATVYLANNVGKVKADKLRSWDANVVYHGSVWDEANHEAMCVAERDGLAYFHPFADAVVIAGQGTVALEILEDAPDVDVILVAIGGGGLISGISLVAKALKPSVKVIGIEPVGAASLYESLKVGKLVELSEVTTTVGTLAPKVSAQINLDIIQKNVDDIILVTDEEMRQAAQWLWFEMGIAAELSGAAAMAGLLTGKVQVEPSQKVCVLVCGAGNDGIA
jgi:threonine dehydratase